MKNLNTATADKNVSTMDDFKHMEKKTFLPTVVVSGERTGPFRSNWQFKNYFFHSVGRYRKKKRKKDQVMKDPKDKEKQSKKPKNKKNSQRKERKATQTLAVVLGIILNTGMG